MRLPFVLDELKAHLNGTEFDDDELHGFAVGATQAVEARVGALEARDVTYRFSYAGGDIALPHYPVIELTSLTSVQPAVVVNIALYELDAAAGVIRCPAGLAWRMQYDLVYVAGRAVVPDDLRLAALIVAAHLYETQRPVSSAGSPFGGAPGSPADGMRGFAWPNRAVELLAPYEQLAFA